jgi:glycosyltransferase involved in cell wall biosynthesis
MYRERRIAAVVPAYNEETLIAKTVQGLPGFVDIIVVVDDCSTDGTFEAVSSVQDDRLVVHRLERNLGVGGAVLAGHRIAMDMGADILVVVAGDDQMDPDHIPRLLDPIVDEGYGFTKGNRFYSMASLEGMPRHRVVGNMGLTFVNKAASGYWNIVDPQNGYTAVTREALEMIPFDKIAQRYDFENDLLVWLNIANVRARDVNIPARYGAETSTISLTSFIPRLLRTFFRGFWRRMWYKYMLWSFSPIALLFLLGIVLLGIGTAVGLWATWEAFHGVSPTAGTTVLSVVPFFCGFVLVVQSLVLDIQATPD